jgi:hypothetical protein
MEGQQSMCHCGDEEICVCFNSFYNKQQNGVGKIQSSTQPAAVHPSCEKSHSCHWWLCTCCDCAAHTPFFVENTQISRVFVHVFPNETLKSAPDLIVLFLNSLFVSNTCVKQKTAPNIATLVLIELTAFM